MIEKNSESWLPDWTKLTILLILWGKYVSFFSLKNTSAGLRETSKIGEIVWFFTQYKQHTFFQIVPEELD